MLSFRLDKLFRTFKNFFHSSPCPSLPQLLGNGRIVWLAASSRFSSSSVFPRDNCPFCCPCSYPGFKKYPFFNNFFPVLISKPSSETLKSNRLNITQQVQAALHQSCLCFMCTGVLWLTSLFCCQKSKFQHKAIFFLMSLYLMWSVRPDIIDSCPCKCYTCLKELTHVWKWVFGATAKQNF